MIQFDLKKWAEAGLLPMPISMPGKLPAGGFSHAAWNAQKPTQEEVEAAWAKFGHAANGVALLCGHGVELLDVDVQADPIGNIDIRFRDALLAAAPEIYAKLVVEKSVSGGTHYWYRVESDMPSTKLARLEYSDADRWALGDKYSNTQVGSIIETRGNGGYGIVAPTPGYELMERGFLDLKLLSEEERDILWQIARSFNTYVNIPTYVQGEHTTGAERPGEDFTRKISVQDFVAIFSAHGWKTLGTRGDYIYLNRPGAKNSRKTDAVIVQSKKLFVPYSTSVIGFDSDRGYSPYRSYAILNHGGDFKKAASALKKEGYGVSDQSEYIPAQTTDTPDSVFTKYEHLRFSIEKRPNVDFNMFVVQPGRTPLSPPVEYGVAFEGALIPVVGKQKSRKTTVMTAIIAAAISGKEVCGFVYRNEGPIVWFDTEQPSLYFWTTQWRICVQAGEVSPWLYSYTLRALDPKARRAAIDEIVAAVKPSIIVIDGVADLITSVNSEEECKVFVDQWLMRLAATGATIFPVLHLNKSDGQMSGWLGTMLGRKSDGTLQVEQADDMSVDVSMRDARAERPPAFRLFTEKGMYGILYATKQPDYDYSIGYPEREKVMGAAQTAEPEFYSMPRPADEDIPF